MTNVSIQFQWSTCFVVTHCATRMQRLLGLVDLNLIKNYLVRASIKTILFFALSIKLARDLLDSGGIITMHLLFHKRSEKCL
jgi:hypothetical protein